MFIVGLLCAIALLSSISDAKQTFPKSEFISHVDFAQNSVAIEKCGGSCMLYAVARNLGNPEDNIVIMQNGAKQISLMKMISDNMVTDGTIQGYKLTGGADYKIVNNNAAGTALSPFFIYVVQSDGANSGTLVYDASRTKTIKPPTDTKFHTMATVLSASSYFTLSGYSMEGATAVDVYTSGFDYTDDSTKIYNSASKEFAAKSLTTVVGPVATLLLGGLDIKTSFSVDVTLEDRRTASVEPGASFVAMSPGYSGNGPNYPSDLGNQVSYKFTLSRSAPVTLSAWTNTIYGVENVTITTSGGNENNVYSYSGNAIKNRQEKFNADSITVSWNRTTPSSYFLVEFTSSAMQMLPACVPLLIAAILRFF